MCHWNRLGPFLSYISNHLKKFCDTLRKYLFWISSVHKLYINVNSRCRENMSKRVCKIKKLSICILWMCLYIFLWYYFILLPSHFLLIYVILFHFICITVHYCMISFNSRDLLFPVNWLKSDISNTPVSRYQSPLYYLSKGTFIQAKPGFAGKILTNHKPKHEKCFHLTIENTFELFTLTLRLFQMQLMSNSTAVIDN